MLRDRGGSRATPTAAIERVLGVTTKELSEDWHAAIRRAYEPVLAAARAAERGRARVTIKGEGLGGDLNVGPAISPDGRWIAFLSDAQLFSIDLFVADAATGKVMRKLTSTATDPHFSSLQFIYSAGAWDAESQRIAIATVDVGQARARDLRRAERRQGARSSRSPSVDEIFNPTWSPDGQAIAFTGMSRGLTDLFVYDLAGVDAAAL